MLVRRVELWEWGSREVGITFHAHDSKSSARRANINFSTIINCFTVIIIIIIIIFLTRATDLSRKGGAACGLQTATELAEI